MAQYQVAGGDYIDETSNFGYQVPGDAYVDEGSSGNGGGAVTPYKCLMGVGV